MNKLLEQFAVEDGVEFPPSYNIAPTDNVLACQLSESGERRLAVMRWGLIPFWASDPTKFKATFNARGEELENKKTFRHPFQRQRCLVLADGFIEWLQVGKVKQPYYFRMKDKAPFAFAGLWDRWRDIESCTIVTTDCNELVKPYHDRMPVILEEGEYAKWLDPSIEEATSLKTVLKPSETDLMAVDPLDRRVNNGRNKEADCIQVVTDPRTAIGEASRQGRLF